jgi:hypothetical protein
MLHSSHRFVLCCLLFGSATLLPAAEDADKLKDNAREIAGTAEFLRSVPKRFAVLQACDPLQGRVTLLLSGEQQAKEWSLVPDAEIKVAGWWGRLDQFHAGDRVWVWFKSDRSKQPVAVSMLADDVSAQAIHNDGVAAGLEQRQVEQRALLRKRWIEEGLPCTVTFLHIFSGEMETMLDHEAQRWGRSLKPGDKVSLVEKPIGKAKAAPPIPAVVRDARPWRERTQVRLVVNGIDQADLTIGQRVLLRMTPPPAETDTAALPPDVDRPRSRSERLEWFLATVYCPCKVKGDVCTGDFYTLASCNPNACGMPHHMRDIVAKKIDEGKTDRQILEELLKEFGPGLLRQHLRP